MGVAVLDVEGDGIEQIVIARAGGTVVGGVSSSGPRLAILQRSETPHAGARLVLSAFGSLDGMAQRWLSFGSTSWLSSSGRKSQELVVLRQYDPKLSGVQQAVNVRPP
jgi:hypothetical protein